MARALTQAVLDAAMFTAQNPDKAAASFQPYAPKTASLQDLQAMVRYHTHHHHPVGRRAQAGAQGLCRRFEGGLGLQAEHRYGQIRGADLCRRIRRLRRSRWRNRRKRERRSRGSRCRCRFRFRRAGPACSQAWHGSDSACPACGGRISATGRGPISSRRAAFVIVWRNFPGDSGRQPARAVQCRPATARAVAAGIRVVPDPVGSRDREVRRGCRCRSSRRRSPSSRSIPMICRNCWTASLPR